MHSYFQGSAATEGGEDREYIQREIPHDERAEMVAQQPACHGRRQYHREWVKGNTRLKSVRVAATRFCQQEEN